MKLGPPTANPAAQSGRVRDSRKPLLEVRAVVALSAVILCSRFLFALHFTTPVGIHEFYISASDPYYICTGIYLSLSEKSMPVLDSVGEFHVYAHLFRNALPNNLRIEAGVNPLPLAGVAVRSLAPTWYSRLAIANANMVRAFTESVYYKEPWSVSIFAGHVVAFTDHGRAIQGHGNIGMQGAFGYWHIRDNVLLPDIWREIEARVDVHRKSDTRRYATSARVGTRIHSNDQIRDVFYVNLSRDRIDFVERGFSFIRNTNNQFRFDFSYQPLAILSLSADAGKKYPFTFRKRIFVLGLSVGLTWSLANPYRSDLAPDFRAHTLTPIIRPMLTF